LAYPLAQLRGWAGQMQSPNLMDHPDPRGKLGLVHNMGLGGAAVVSLMRRPEFWDGNNEREDGRNRCVPLIIEDDTLLWSWRELGF
jgi:sterol carrier protein 2